MNKKYDMKDIVKLLEKCKEKYLTSDSDIIGYLNNNGCMIGIDQFNKVIKKAREITEYQNDVSNKKVDNKELEITERLLYLRDKLKMGIGSLAKKIMVEALEDESLDKKIRVDIAFKIYDRFNKDYNITEEPKGEEKDDIMTLLRKGMVRIEVQDAIAEKLKNL